MPHLLAVTDAPAVMHGGPAPFLQIHMQAGLVTNLLLGLSPAVPAVLAARTGVLGTGAVAVLAVVGGVAFAAAAPLIVATGVEVFAILFSGSVLIGFWLLISGVALAQLRLRSDSVSGAAASPEWQGPRSDRGPE